MTERRLDEAIDRAVHAIMDVDPRPGLSRRVAARLDEPRTSWLTVPRLAAAGALVVLAVAAVLLAPTTPAPVREQVSVTLKTAPPAPRVDRQAGITSLEPARVQPERVSRAPRTPRRVEKALEEIPPFARNVHVAPLADIAPIVVGPTGPRALDAPEVLVLPIAPIEPVRIDPLSSTPH